MQRQAAAPPPRQRRQPRRRPAAAPAARPARRLLALTALAALLAAAAAAPPGAAPPDANARPQTVGPGPLWAAGSTPVKISASSGDVFSALVNTTAVVRPMRQILGVSIEWQRAADYGGERWARVLQQLGPAPVLRVGGLSTELLQAVPPPSTWAALRSLAQKSGARLIINLKLSGGNLNFTETLMRRALRELGPYIQGFELGNEPLYWPGVTGVGGYSSKGEFSEGYGSFLDYYVRAAARLRTVNATVPFYGPSWHHFTKDWTEEEMWQFGHAAFGLVNEAALHWYPPFPKDPFTATDLLSEGLMREAIANFKRAQWQLRSLTGGRGEGPRVTEGNSMYHCGKQGVSDVFAAALWTADFAFELAAAGATGWNVHWSQGGSPPGRPVDGFFWPCYYMGVETLYRPGPGQNGSLDPYPQARAPWGGYMLFARAVEGDVGLLPIETASAGGACAGLKLWPLQTVVTKTGDDASRDVRIVAINKNPSGSCLVDVELAGGRGAPVYGDGSIQYLLPGGAGAAERLEALAAGQGCAGKACAKAAPGVTGHLGLADYGVSAFGDQKMDVEGYLVPRDPMTYDTFPQKAARGRLRYTFVVPGGSAAMLSLFQE